MASRFALPLDLRRVALLLAASIGVFGLGNRSSAGENSTATDPVAHLASAIDHEVSARWSEEQLEPAPPADDAEFLRRTYLNIVGRIPSCSEVQMFLEETRPDKRRAVVDCLLESPAYATHFAGILRAAIVPEVSADPQLQFQGAAGFEQWLRRRIAEDAGYDRIARELLTAPAGSQGPGFYFIAKGGKPENLAAGASRVFLGVRIECAQCHNHPFAKWKREQFWELAAFFAGVDRPANGPIGDDARLSQLKIPGLEKVVQARFLDESSPNLNGGGKPREALAKWMTASDNAYFAKAAVNRVWAHFFGTGIVDPIDDFDESNPPSHPQLLEAMAADFMQQKCDVKFLIRSICASRPYQLSSVQTDPRQSDRHFFARAALKGLTATELAASIAQAVGEFDAPNDNAMQPPGMPADTSTLKTLVAELFKNDNVDPVDNEATILQALGLMNGAAIDESTAPSRGNTLGAVLESPFLDTAGRIEVLYLSTLSRKPTKDESARFVKFVESGGTHSASKPKMGSMFKQLITTDRTKSRGDKGVALGDVFWALLNSSEFLTNH